MSLSPISGPRVLLEGPGGTGKTYALRTLVAAGITPFVAALDHVGMEAVADIKCPKLHWHAIKPVSKTWATMIHNTETWAPYDATGLAGLKDGNKSTQQHRFIDTLKTLADFSCDRCGEKFGMVDTWSTSRAIVVDHFTELCQAGKEWTVGEKLLMHQGEWQVAQNLVEGFVRQMVSVPRCWVILIAHIDREVDEVMGGVKIMTHALGRKLAPKLPPLFSDVILAQRVGDKFTWNTASPDTDLKTRNLRIAAGLNPDFGEIVKTWQSRGGIIEQ